MSQSHDDLYLHKYRRIIDRQIFGSTDDTVVYTCTQNRDNKSKLRYYICIKINILFILLFL